MSRKIPLPVTVPLFTSAFLLALLALLGWMDVLPERNKQTAWHVMPVVSVMGSAWTLIAHFATAQEGFRRWWEALGLLIALHVAALGMIPFAGIAIFLLLGPKEF